MTCLGHQRVAKRGAEPTCLTLCILPSPIAWILLYLLAPHCRP